MIDATAIATLEDTLEDAWLDQLAYDECAAEFQAQYRNEVAMFGDAGPGQYSDMVGAAQAAAELAAAHAAELTGLAEFRDALTPPRLPTRLAWGIEEPF